MRLRLLITALCLLAPVFSVAAQESARQSLTIFAATSLTDAFESLSTAFMEANPEVDIQLNLSSSSTLAAQLLQGAPADIFASANETQMDIVIESGIIAEETVAVFAHNQLVLITPAANPAAIESIADLANEPVLLVLAAQGTPIRAYTDAMLVSHNEDFGEDFADNVMLNLASEESNVRQVVTRVALGEADAGIVYRTDALGDVAANSYMHRLKLTRLITSSRHIPSARFPRRQVRRLPEDFIAFALSPEGQAILTGYGFCSPAILTDAPGADITPEPTIEAEATAESDVPEPDLPGANGHRLIGCSFSPSAPLLSCFWQRRYLVLVSRGLSSRAWQGLPDSSVILSATLLSFASTAAVVCLAAAFGTPLAYVLSRYDFKGKRFVSLFIELPIVMPPAVAGLALLLTFGRSGVIGSHLARFRHHHSVFDPCRHHCPILYFGAILHSIRAGWLRRHRRRN